jgi:hypothetical protein
MIATDLIESREVESASNVNVSGRDPGVNEMKYAHMDITTSENKMVVAVKKLQNPVKTWNAECLVSQSMTTRVIERYFEELELILTV